MHNLKNAAISGFATFAGGAVVFNGASDPDPPVQATPLNLEGVALGGHAIIAGSNVYDPQANERLKLVLAHEERMHEQRQHEQRLAQLSGINTLRPKVGSTIGVPPPSGAPSQTTASSAPQEEDAKTETKAGSGDPTVQATIPPELATPNTAPSTPEEEDSIEATTGTGELTQQTAVPPANPPINPDLERPMPKNVLFPGIRAVFKRVYNKSKRLQTAYRSLARRNLTPTA
ncbi:hypothetical protein CC1G_04026 [Coprinopsis cinerea okayama7|uniref:Uncharacterized protein n=1 Tax=Coprinopsis cinerea (strain Okayama-7 / 130 / ATCC MYA-4618 / FGSC 9003) TaxID=240176 RepID=A8N8H9_COPC7|nr:hypothetical protein CC1G_04026 [Coprinopsis cinerea okayama7\|eukprot:XP_001831135.1 hypothetical protein CC1G_04026 [Coprinopsis cinerea okayama7\